MAQDTDIATSELLEILATTGLEQGQGRLHTIESDENDYSIDSDDFDIAVTVNEADDRLTIRKIDVRGNTGLSSKLMAVIHDFADNHKLTVTVLITNERDAHFFRKMGYMEGSDEGEFFRAR